VLCAGVVQTVQGGIIRYQVRNATAGSGFGQNAQAAPGDTIEVRIRIAYNGDAPIYAFRNANLQPLLAGNFGTFAGNDRIITDSERYVGPRTGGNATTPLGSVFGEAGQYGRVRSFGSQALSASMSNAPRAFYGTGTASGLARISQARATNWIGQGTGINNVTGAGGFQLSQLHPAWGIAAGFNEWNSGDDAEGEYVFQFGLVVGEGIGRSISVTTGLVYGGNDFPNPPVPGQVAWYTSSTSLIPFVQTDAVSVPGIINVVPAPSTSMLALFSLAALTRRQRTHGRA
jgi:hypothetical protein